MKTEVQQFISRFTERNSSAIIECFSFGCCYWFAFILQERFGGLLMYDEIENHFGCKIHKNVYDITGDVTSKYHWRPWPEIRQEDAFLYARIVRDCVNF